MTGRRANAMRGVLLTGLALVCVTLPCGQIPQSWGQTTAGRGVEMLLPAQAVLYLGIDGGLAHRAAWEKTAEYEAFYQTGLADLMQKAIVYFINQLGPNEKEELQVLDQISQNGASVAVSISAGGLPLPQAIVVLHQGKPLAAALGEFFQKATAGGISFATRDVRGRRVTSGVVPNSPGVEFGWWVEGPHLVLTGGIGAIDAAMAVAEGKAANMTTNPLWKKVRDGHAGFEVSLASWLDFAALRARFGAMEIPNPKGGETPPVAVNKILKVLGLDTLGPLTYRWGMKDRATWSETWVDAPSPRTGLMAIFEHNLISLDDLPPMPVNTAGFYASGFDWSNVYGELVKVLRGAAQMGPPEAPAQLEAIFDQVPQALGFDLVTDLFEPLGNVIGAYSDQQQGLFGFGFVVAAKVDDAAKLRKTFATLVLRLSAQPSRQFVVKPVTKHGREMMVLQMGEVHISPTIVVDDRWLAIGSTTQSVESFLLRLDGKLPRWKPGEEINGSKSPIPAKFATITCTDPRETIRTLLGFAPMLLQAAARLPRAGRNATPFPIRADDLPPFELITSPLFPNVSVFTTDKTELRWISRSSAPSILLPSGMGGSNLAVTATLAVLLLPAVQSAPREASRRSQSRNNLKQIGRALHNYHDGFGHFPQGTHPNGKLKPEQRLSWQADLLPYLDQAALHRQIKFDQAWDDKSNANVIKIQIPTYLNPQTPTDAKAGPNMTHYVGLAGLGENGPLLPANDRKAGVFAYDRATRFQDIVDGATNTIAVIEASKEFGPWAAGGKATVRPLTKQPYINGPDGIGSSFTGGCNALFGDGSVRFLSEKIDPKVMEALTTISGGEVIN